MSSPRIFVSYSLTDSDVGSRIVDELQLAGLDVWFADHNLKAGTSLSRGIEEELLVRNVLIVLLSPASVESEWVEAEVSYFLHLRSLDARKMVIPVRIDACDSPLRLSPYKWVDFVGHPWDVAMDELKDALGITPSRNGELASEQQGLAVSFQVSLYRRLDGQRGSVLGVAFSPDGSALATASEAGGVQTWDVRSGLPKSLIVRHPAEISAVAYSPDGRLLATASYDQTARLWDTKSSDPSLVMSGHSGWLSAVAFSPDGRLLATASYDQTARLWDVSTGALVARLVGHAGYVLAAAFSPDGWLLATASSDQTARLWDVSTGALVAKLEGHAGYVHSVAFSPDGRLLATASYDQTARLWDVQTRRTTSMLAGHQYGLNTVQFSGSVIRLASNTRTRAGATLNTAHMSGNVVSVIGTGSVDGSVRLWRQANGQTAAVVAAHRDQVRALAWHPTLPIFATGSDDRAASLWQVNLSQDDDTG